VPGLGTKKAGKGAKLAPVAEKRILPVRILLIIKYCIYKYLKHA